MIYTSEIVIILFRAVESESEPNGFGSCIYLGARATILEPFRLQSRMVGKSNRFQEVFKQNVFEIQPLSNYFLFNLVLFLQKQTYEMVRIK